MTNHYKRRDDEGDNDGDDAMFQLRNSVIHLLNPITEGCGGIYNAPLPQGRKFVSYFTSDVCPELDRSQALNPLGAGRSTGACTKTTTTYIFGMSPINFTSTVLLGFRVHKNDNKHRICLIFRR